ncbi:MAG: hypothetical protein HY343_09410 [Lentisphaerae bacterium]|nr:hypothetical protein [Lentisphaerota bacterium]
MIALAFLTQVHPATAESVTPSQALIDQMREAVESAREEAPRIAALADAAADGFIRAEVIYCAPNQEGFLSELLGRAGGMTALTKWDGRNSVKKNAPLLLALEPYSDHPDRVNGWVDQAVTSGASVIVFAAPGDLACVPRAGGGFFQPADFSGFVDNHTASSPLRMPNAGGGYATVYLSGVVNMMYSWMFTGELAAACTRRGKMPVFWLSIAIDEPRGSPRLARYSKSIPEGKKWGPQKAFHDDMTVPPVSAGVVAGAYLDFLEGCLDELERGMRPSLEKAVQRTSAVLRNHGKAYVYALGHCFPLVVPKQQWHDGLIAVGPEWMGLRDEFKREAGEGDAFLILGMPLYPAKDVAAGRAKKMSIMAMSMEKPDVPAFETPDFLWMHAPWPVEDGAVRLPGYDINILPVTGVMNTLIYYMIRSELE